MKILEPKGDKGDYWTPDYIHTEKDVDVELINNKHW